MMKKISSQSSHLSSWNREMFIHGKINNLSKWLITIVIVPPPSKTVITKETLYILSYAVLWPVKKWWEWRCRHLGIFQEQQGSKHYDVVVQWLFLNQPPACDFPNLCSGYKKTKCFPSIMCLPLQSCFVFTLLASFSCSNLVSFHMYLGLQRTVVMYGNTSL